MGRLSPLEIVSIAALAAATIAASGTLQLVLALAMCGGVLLGWALWPLRELPRGGRPLHGGRSLRSLAGRRSRG